MWKKANGRLICISDSSRIAFRTSISKAILEHLEKVASDNNTFINYLLESGLQVVLAQGGITFNKDHRPKDRIHYKTTYDKELLEKVKKFAKDHGLYINDIIEYSVNYMDLESIKKTNYRHRIE